MFIINTTTTTTTTATICEGHYFKVGKTRLRKLLHHCTLSSCIVKMKLHYNGTTMRFWRKQQFKNLKLLVQLCPQALYHCFVVIILLICIAICLLQLYSLCYTGHGKIAENAVRPRRLRKQSGLWYIVKHVRRPAVAGPVSWQWMLCTLLETLRCLTQLTFRHLASSVYDRRFTTHERMHFIYLINKYISLSDIYLAVHHWYK